ncbi:MAG: heme o synthase [Holosporales bacterium]
MASVTTLSILTAAAESKPATAGDYFSLLKPRVMSLVVFTGLIGMVAAPNGAALHPLSWFVALLCIAVGAGAAGAFNMWFERHSDALMPRTAQRPLPRGVIAAEDALFFSIALSLASVALMALAVNFTAALWLLLSILFYCLIYTVWLKRRTPQNIVIGGAAGAFPPVIGWAAVTGGVGSLEPWLLFLVIFLWTPPHFWALALYRAEEYSRAGIPMLPVVKGRMETLKQMMLYTVALVGVSILPVIFGYVGIGYAVWALVLGAVFMAAVTNIFRCDFSDKSAKQAFGISILYLFLIFCGYGIAAGFSL